MLEIFTIFRQVQVMTRLGHGRFLMFTVILHWTSKSWAATRIKLDMFSHKTYRSIFTKTSLSYSLTLPLAYEETLFRGMFLTSVFYTKPKLEKFQVWWLSKFIAFPFLIPAASMYRKCWKIGWDSERKLKRWVLQISLLFLKDWCGCSVLANRSLSNAAPEGPGLPL